MSDKELQSVYEELKQIRETITFCENRVESLEYEIRLNVAPMSEKIYLLESMVNPLSEDCKPLADWYE